MIFLILKKYNRYISKGSCLDATLFLQNMSQIANAEYCPFTIRFYCFRSLLKINNMPC